MRSHIQTDEKSFALGKKYDSNKKTQMFGTLESDFGNNIFSWISGFLQSLKWKDEIFQ